jgi:hypothetical protein
MTALYLKDRDTDSQNDGLVSVVNPVLMIMYNVHRRMKRLQNKTVTDLWHTSSTILCTHKKKAF